MFIIISFDECVHIEPRAEIDLLVHLNTRLCMVCNVRMCVSSVREKNKKKRKFFDTDLFIDDIYNCPYYPGSSSTLQLYLAYYDFIYIV